MKNIFLLSLLMIAFMGNAQNESIHNLSFVDIEGKTVQLSSFKGKKILFINTASKCGFTPQYAELQKLHEKYGDKLVLIGFPCDQFGGQEPGTESEIKSFCEKNYGVSFLMASKIEVKGDGQHEIYKWLTSKDENGVESSSVSWNFEKYMVDENGHYMKHFKSMVTPMSEKLTSEL